MSEAGEIRALGLAFRFAGEADPEGRSLFILETGFKGTLPACLDEARRVAAERLRERIEKQKQGTLKPYNADGTALFADLFGE